MRNKGKSELLVITSSRTESKKSALVPMETVEELDAKLQSYKDKFQLVETALKSDPDNEALIKVKQDLLDVINLTEDLLKFKKKPVELSIQEKTSSVSSIPSLPQFPVGTRVCAFWSEDGLWYEAIVTKTPDETVDKYFVTFVGYGNVGELALNEIAPLSAKSSLEMGEPATSKDVSAAEKQRGEIPIPKNLKILPTDSEEVRNSKRKRIKAIKSENRKMKLEEDRNTKKNAWQEFTSKAKRAKTGFYTGRQKESIFKSPDSVSGKVGVTGSGKELTAMPTFKATEVKRTKANIPLPD